MGIYDREYYREKKGGIGSLSRLSVNTWLIVVNVAIFIVMAMSHELANRFYAYGHFSTYYVTWGGGLQFWRFITFQFLHAGVTHVAFNMLGLYIFGGMVEDFLGRKKYLAFYLTCGIFAGLMYLLLDVVGIIPKAAVDPHNPMTQFMVPLVGASGGVLGVILACAYIAPTMQVQLLFPPIPMKLRTLAYCYVALSVGTLLFRGNNAGGEAAHLGGAIAGAFFIRNSHLLRDFFDVFSDSRKTPTTPRRVTPRSARENAEHEAEVDRILDKTRQEGIQSLTEKEKAILARDTERRRAQG